MYVDYAADNLSQDLVNREGSMGHGYWMVVLAEAFEGHEWTLESRPWTSHKNRSLLPPPPRPMATHDKGLPGLPDDIICEIFGLLDTGALESCSLACKALSYSAKPFIHRTLYLTQRSGAPTGPNVPASRNELKGLPVLGERGLLQHTRHLSIFLHDSDPLFAHNLQPYIQHLRTLTSVRSLGIGWLDTPSFFQKEKEFFGAFFGSLQSLELVSPRGYHKRILYFICQFPNIRDLGINGVQGYTGFAYNGDPHFDIKTSPPLDGTLDLQLKTGLQTAWGDSMGAQFMLTNLPTLPSGLKFRTLKLSGCGGDKPQLLVDACARTLECMEFTGKWFGASFLLICDCPKFTRFTYQAPHLIPHSVLDDSPHSESLKSNYPTI